MKTSVVFYEVTEPERRSRPRALNDDRIEYDDAYVVVPNVGDKVVFKSSDKLETREVVSRKIWYHADHCNVDCETVKVP
jgi:hypothetical protein